MSVHEHPLVGVTTANFRLWLLTGYGVTRVCGMTINRSPAGRLHYLCGYMWVRRDEAEPIDSDVAHKLQLTYLSEFEPSGVYIPTAAKVAFADVIPVEYVIGVDAMRLAFVPKSDDDVSSEGEDDASAEIRTLATRDIRSKLMTIFEDMYSK